MSNLRKQLNKIAADESLEQLYRNGELEIGKYIRKAAIEKIKQKYGDKYDMSDWNMDLSVTLEGSTIGDDFRKFVDKLVEDECQLILEDAPIKE